jgi:site-specific recombinase XerD
MKAKPISFDQLCFNAAHQLITKRNLTQETVKQYACYWRRIKRYLLDKRIKEFNSSVGNAYLLANFGSVDYSSLGKGQKDFIRSVRVISEFSDTRTIAAVKEQIFFNGPIGEAMQAYIEYRVSLRLKKHTIEEGQLYMSRFNKYLHATGVRLLHKISAVNVLNFVKGMDPKHPTLVAGSLETLRGFFKYANNEGMIVTDPAVLVPKYKYTKQPKLPSFYSPDEIEKMIGCIDRSRPIGKRNHAVVLLAARLGLRASDIANLKFENLHWDRNLIILNQVKTVQQIELPILPEVGNAIIDYVKYGRPKSDLRSVFLIANSSYNALTSCSITGIVHSYFVEAGIDISKRKHGPHALRHSLASILLEKSTMLPVITEVLGHRDTASTQFYLRIDRKSMSRCTLEVPPVNASFYQQQKEYLYA